MILHCLQWALTFLLPYLNGDNRQESNVVYVAMPTGPTIYACAVRISIETRATVNIGRSYLKVTHEIL